MIRFGGYLENPWTDHRCLARTVLEMERLGFDSVWMEDHMVMSLGSEYLKTHKRTPPLSVMASPVLECWTMLSWLTPQTRSIRLGTLTLNNLLRYPSVLAKMSSTLDVVSNGRLEFGIGAGYWKPEFEMYGIPVPTLSTRIEQLVEGIQIIKSMWTKEVTDFTGKHYTVKQALNNPKPVQKPHPPITIGGRSRNLMGIAAQFADNWNAPSAVSLTPEQYGLMAATFNECCTQAGRSPKEIVKSINIRCIVETNPHKLREKVKRFKPEWESEDSFMNRLIGLPEQCVEKLNKFKDKGAEYFIVHFLDATEDSRSMELFAEEIIPAVK